MFEWLFWILFFLILYIYILYPVLLLLISTFVYNDIEKREFEPFVSFIITAYNEEKDLEKKLFNTLTLDYPKELLEIIVASDGSTDSTDDIVKMFKNEGVRLIRIEGRVGKTETQNQVVEKAKGDIIIFSDAASLYSKYSLRALVRNFADPSVGGVAGKCQYIDPDIQGDMSLSTKIYWHFEMLIKQCQSNIRTLTGASGLIYAVRKSLYEPLPSHIISDMVEPMTIVKKGKRFVYEPDAIAYESTTSGVKEEFKMRVRVLSRGYSGIIFMKALLNPFKYFWISFQIFSHKILRWFTPTALILLFIFNFMLITDIYYMYLFFLQVFFYTMLIIFYYTLGRKNFTSQLFVYIVVAAAASFFALYKVSLGRNIVVWHTERN